MPHTIPVAFISDDNFIMQTAVAVTSLLQNAGPDTEYAVHVIMAECSDASRERLASLPGVRLVTASLDEYRDIRQLSHIPIACLLKFNVCELLPEYDKLIYLDGDVIVRRDLSALYDTDLTDYVAAAVPQTVIGSYAEKKIGAGVILFNARRMREERLKDQLVETRRALGDRGSMDQQSFNLLLGDRFRRIDLRYNFCPSMTQDFIRVESIETLNALYESSYRDYADTEAQAVIMHFATGLKPWLYAHVPGGDEWLSYYERSPFAGERLRLKQHYQWELRWKSLRCAYGQNGLSGALDYLAGGVKRKVFKKYDRENKWG